MANKIAVISDSLTGGIKAGMRFESDTLLRKNVSAGIVDISGMISAIKGAQVFQGDNPARKYTSAEKFTKVFYLIG
jgi:hypothetical protein